MKIKITVEEIKEENAVLQISGQNSINWPTNKLPAKTKKGDILTFFIYNKNMVNTDEQLAKDILNEILTIDSDE